MGLFSAYFIPEKVTKARYKVENGFLIGFLYYKLAFYGFILQGLRDVYSDFLDFPYKMFKTCIL
jgi:hypothetical protein